MIDANQPYIFPAWVTRFQGREIATRLEHIAEIRSKRAQGNQRLPHVHLDERFWRCYKLYPLLRSANVSLTDKEKYDAHFTCIAAFTSVTLRTFWARWLYLERAFEVASQAGDLLFGAILLRTMAKDVWALRELDRLMNQINPLVASPDPDDFARLQRLGDLLWSRFLPPSKEVPELPGQTSFERFEGPDHTSLKLTFQRLNDYVHPNYGSHLLALFPERVRALEILLDAYIEVYEAFFQLPWAEGRVEEPSTALPPVVVRPLKEEIDLFLSSLLPDIQQHRAQRGLAPADADPAPYVRNFIGNVLQDDCKVFWQVAPDWFEPLRPLASFLLGSLTSDRELCNSLLERCDIGIAQLSFSLSLLAGGRRLAIELEQSFPGGRPDPKKDFSSWLRFCVKAIETLLTTTEYKIDVISWALIRQLNDRNPIGSILAMRSLIEHYAVAVYVGERLDKSWRKVARKGSRGRLDREEVMKLLVKVEEHIARFLAGTKGTNEDARWWKKEWQNIGLDKAIRLGNATRHGLEQDDLLSYLYNFGSDVIHGRKARGVELCPPTADTYVKANLSRGVLALDLLQSPDYMMSRLANSAMVLKRMETLQQALVETSDDPSSIIQRAFSYLTGDLVHGIHYSGSGTLQDPFVFSPGVEYYDAFGKLCAQLGLDREKRRLIQGVGGRFLDAVPDQHGKIYYFAAPILPILPSKS